ncbi:mechanosensitive ion channel [Rhodococcus hoagii]|jgi:small conductance mechanosensitive channel|uniref:Transporter, small conductance mechanosensitive ion channel MscS family protein n=3 Tax=Rhodococcus hoagii TaxID=43767 RepID=E9T3L3_RHOHA|nr:mechanosensitive ion channel family protein [Prescottella equi]MCD7051220.1 mechanosensitive ion channel family protein [Rhodococcus sp. BH2-1]GBF12991.1 putative MscS family protein YkuT [Rhodococcus sp. Br-6]AVP69467.1 mechanosensitive ion channel family protein [Prescottella equi]EGD23437.1 transporter, small conductance mechanosensitive ion channel MscS family protein [Prescottella equi ATCC 33707]ERN44147.1 mechanosensitive ion channel MscS [Prescottella equi NBRC 101255 = C 7]
MQTTHLALTFTPYDRLLDWLKVTGLPIALTVLGAVILARFVNWAGGRITQRIDDNYQQGDALVRSEATKHRHSVAQVITWVVITIIYVITAMKVLNLLGLPIGSLVAPATVLGAALGFGAQRVVQDILAGFFIITERQYGFGDTVQIAITGSGTDAEGVIEDVTLRVTRMRNADGEVITVPNGQIVKAVNLSKDWARAVVDVPIPASADINRVNDILHRVGVDAYEDKSLRPLLLDTPSVMGVESLAVDQVSVRMVARTLPGKQFQVGRALRVRVVTALRRAGITVAAELEADPVGGGDDE